MAKTQIKNYVFKPGIGANDSRFPNAYGLISSNKSFIQKEMSAFIANRVGVYAIQDFYIFQALEDCRHKSSLNISNLGIIHD